MSARTIASLHPDTHPEAHAEARPKAQPEPNDPYASSIERYHGSVRTPVGLAGPLQVFGDHAHGAYPVPLATTERALVASYHRGCLALDAAGGCRSIVVAEAMTRTPCFRFEGARESHAFIEWAKNQTPILKGLVEKTSNHCKLQSVDGQVEGNHAFLELAFATGEAAGQNMVTIATEAICSHIMQSFYHEPESVYIEANLSGDKKATANAMTSVRGKRVVAEVRIDAQVSLEYFGCTPEAFEDHWYASAMGGALSGSVGLHGHYANALAALYIALGQDAACVAESAVGITRMSARHDQLYASVTLPNVIVGTVGGGTQLPDQASYIESMKLPEHQPAHALAEIIGAVCLAGELSIASSIANGTFARAHRILGRRRSRHVNR